MSRAGDADASASRRGSAELQEVLDAQTTSGAFASTVHFGGQSQADENSFVTALIVAELGRQAGAPGVAAAIERALAFLVRCEAEGRPGFFRFYPVEAHPLWLTARLPPDADDTALIAPLLVRHGVRDDDWLQFVLEKVLRPHRQLYLAEWSQPWHRAGAFHTWLRRGTRNNDIDCCVNLNVLALIGQLPDPETNGDRETIVALLHAALDWAGDSGLRLGAIAPWYPDPLELARAMQRAVLAGAVDLADTLATLRSARWYEEPGRTTLHRPVCGSPDRRFVWTCPTLHRARALHGEADCRPRRREGRDPAA